MSEQQIIDWLAAHPFLKAQITLTLGAVSAFWYNDAERFLRGKAENPNWRFNFLRAGKELGKGILLSLIPSFLAKAAQLLGA